jgi:proto-oncogene serine/threonine-protein kinase Pim-3
MLPQNVDPNVLLMNYASALGGIQTAGYPGPAGGPGPLPLPTNEEAILALNLFYVQSAMAQLAAQKELLNNRLYAQQAAVSAAAVQNPLKNTEETSLPASPASMSPTRTESASPQPAPIRSQNPYRRKRGSEDYYPMAKRTKNSVPVKNRTVKQPVDLKQTFLDLYEVYGVIGVGGGGMVYAGRRITDKLPVAIKRVMREKVKRWEKVQGHSVPQEIALMLRVYGHKGVIKLVDWYECLDSFILIMERPENSVDLFDYIRESGKMNEQEAKIIFKQVVEAVGHIHSCGVVHRDIKDENVILNRESGEIKLIDFGCGTLLKDQPYRDFSGTPEFYPPEWFERKIYHARSAATWSLGVLLYDMLCGEIPFKSKEKIIENNLHFKHRISDEACDLIKRMLQHDPDRRPNLNSIISHKWFSS